MIEIVENRFRLTGDGWQYAFFHEGGKLFHAHYGEDLGSFYNDCESMPMNETREYSEFGRYDFRVPSIVIKGNESLSTDFTYDKYEILTEKPNINMPALRGKKETLSIILREKRLGLKLTLFYTVYDEALVRSACLENEGEETVTIEKISAGCFEFGRRNYEILTLVNGYPNSERSYCREKLTGGIKKISSESGFTSHANNSFIAIMEDGALEESGNVYGFNFIYSGNFSIESELDCYSRVRVVIGENILYGGIDLSPKENFYTPEVVSVFSSNGIGGMSRKFHRLYRKHLIDPRFADKIRPIVINSWESIEYDIREERLFEFIGGAKDLGIDLVVLDDGWYGQRNGSNGYLGDWYVNTTKLPNGLNPIIDKCHEYGMKFGLWFSPEETSPNSAVYLAHPEWVIHTPGVEEVRKGDQLVLDFSKKEVVDYVFDSMSKILTTYEVDYVKWDMNRYISDATTAKKYRGHILGVYDLYERLTRKFPHILIEGCFSGGGRFDAGILYYSPMIWTSDNTDAWCRSKIQYSTSLCYPLQTMSNHVSRIPNNQTKHLISFATRGNVAKFGTFGYELDLSRVSDEDRALVKKQTAEYKKDAELILTGDLYRYMNPHTDGFFSQMVVSEDKTKAVFLYVRQEGRIDYEKEPNIRLYGLDENQTYKLEETGEVFTGKQLVKCGIVVTLQRGDYSSAVYHFTAI